VSGAELPPARTAVLALAVVAVVTLLALGGRWQRQTADLVGERPAPPGWGLLGPPLLIVAVAVVVFVALVGIARAFRTATRRLAGRLPAPVPRAIAGVAAATVIGFAVVAAVDHVVVHRVLGAVDDAFAVTDRGTAEGVHRPASGLRSGGPGSLLPWDELGREGRTFVAGGPTVAELAAFAGRPAEQPIRVYGGLATDETLHDLAGRVVRELRRTGAFDRRVLCVAIPTGTGWVNQDAVAALEYLYGGDSAVATMQYSYLPSPLAFLVDPEQAEHAGRELFDQVYAAWSGLPAGRRPRLVVYGESLGSTGVQAAFADLGDAEERTGGALFVGPPHSNALWSATVRRRDPSTPIVLPVYEGGRVVRFASAALDLTRPAGPWGEPRIAFLQHPSDPIVWWSPKLLFERPGWLAEPRGADVNPHALVAGGHLLAGHGGHGGLEPDAGRPRPPLRRVRAHLERRRGPAGWTAADTARLAEHLTTVAGD
jgi:uncharacterized membrane protein